MFRGPTIDNIGPLSLLHPGTTGDLIEGDGNPVTSPVEALGNTYIGSANTATFFIAYNLLVPAANNHIKYIDIMTEYNYDGSARYRWPDGYEDGDPVALDEAQFYVMDSVPERDRSRLSTNVIWKRWRATRLPNPIDPDQAHPIDRGVTDPTSDHYPTFSEPSVGDYVRVYWYPIAVDDTVAAIFREGEWIQIGVMPGGYARTP